MEVPRGFQFVAVSFVKVHKNKFFHRAPLAGVEVPLEVLLGVLLETARRAVRVRFQEISIMK